MTATTFERLQAILVRDYALAPAAVTPEAPLDALGIDSLGLAELLFNVEDEFGVKLPAEPVQATTLGDVVRFIDGLVAQRDAGPAPAQAPEASRSPTP